MEDGHMRIVTTGGTFDKQYDAIAGELTFHSSQLPRLLQQARCTLDVEVEAPVAVDSLVMTEEQRVLIAASCLSSPQKYVVVIHGTDTMVQTARVVAGTRTADDRHVVVFTGAMIPYSLEGSDAAFNLGSAMTAAQTMAPGVYICMGGRIFTWDNCIKNKAKGIFETLH